MTRTTGCGWGRCGTEYGLRRSACTMVGRAVPEWYRWGWLVRLPLRIRLLPLRTVRMSREICCIRGGGVLAFPNSIYVGLAP